MKSNKIILGVLTTLVVSASTFPIYKAASDTHKEVKAAQQANEADLQTEKHRARELEFDLLELDPKVARFNKTKVADANKELTETLEDLKARKLDKEPIVKAALERKAEIEQYWIDFEASLAKGVENAKMSIPTTNDDETWVDYDSTLIVFNTPDETVAYEQEIKARYKDIVEGYDESIVHAEYKEEGNENVNFEARLESERAVSAFRVPGYTGNELVKILRSNLEQHGQFYLNEEFPPYIVTTDYKLYGKGTLEYDKLLKANFTGLNVDIPSDGIQFKETYTEDLRGLISVIKMRRDIASATPK